MFSSIFEAKTGLRNKQVYGGVNSKAISNSVIASSRKHTNFEQVGLVDSNEYLPQIGSLKSKANSIQPEVKSFVANGNFISSLSPKIRISPSSKKKNDDSRFSHSASQHIELLNKNPSRHFTNNASQETTVTANVQSSTTPYKDFKLSNSVKRELRNNRSQRSESDERLDEWSQIFSLQHSRWQEEFDDLKARFLSDFEKQKILKAKQMLPQAKPTAKFQIPNEYLPLEKRTVRDGLEGTKERLRRDKFYARRLNRKKTTQNLEDTNQLRHETSVMTMQHRGNSQLELGGKFGGAHFSSQREFESTLDITTTLNNSTSLGRILYTKEELSAQRGQQAKVKLPQIYKKSLKDISKKIQLLRTSESVQQMSQNSSFESSTRTAQSPPGNLYGSNETFQRQNKQFKFLDQHRLANQAENGSMRIVVNQSSPEQTSQQLRDEVHDLFKKHPDGNPFQIMLEKNKVDAVNITHERQQIINHLTHKTKTQEQVLLDAYLGRSLNASPIKDLANTVNLNINLTINQYGTEQRKNRGLNKDIECSVEYGSSTNLQPDEMLSNLQINSPKSLRVGKDTQNFQQKDSINQRSRRFNQIKISKRQMLEPLKLASQLKSLEFQKDMNQPRLEDLVPETLLDLKEKMGDQKLQIGMVRQFVDKQIENEFQREKIKKSLIALQSHLEKQGMTLREVVDKHIAQLRSRINQSTIQINPKLGKNGEKFRERFEQKSNGFDFIRILEVSSSLKPLIIFQRQLKSRSKRRRLKHLAEIEQLKRENEEELSLHMSEEHYQQDPSEKMQHQNNKLNDTALGKKGSQPLNLRSHLHKMHYVDGDVKKRMETIASDNLEKVISQNSRIDSDYSMPHLEKKQNVFKDQDESIANFIESIKQLIFLSDGQKVNGQGYDSEYNWVEEPEFYQSSSGESKYSNEDKELKDHLAIGEPALLNTMKKYKNADKIVQINEVQGKDESTSHLVKYFQQMSHKGQIPKAFGMIHRKIQPNEMNAGQVLISNEHADAIANSVSRAKFVNKIILKNVGLKDDQAIKIIRNMDKNVVSHLDISQNPMLTKKFYTELNQLLADETCALERIDIEGNNVGDAIIHDMVQAMITSKRIVYLNVSDNGIEDAGARDLALLIQECPKLRLLFMHYNRIMGLGGVQIAEAVGSSKSLQVLDISYNSLCGTGRIKKKEEMTEEDKTKKDDEKKQGKKKKKAPKKGPGVQFGEGTKPAAKGFAQLFSRGFSESWSEAFSSNKSLLHVDFSHNHLERTDVEIIAEGLKENQQILGFHFAGNDGQIDNRGFVKPGVPLSVSENSMLTRMQNQMQAGIIKNSKALELQSCSNCWICEGWSEHHFKFIPGQSDNKPDHDIYKPIKLHLDIDHFEGDLMTPSDSNPNVYEVYRMLPPGPHRYFYSDDGQPVVAQDQLKTFKTEKRLKKAMLNLERTKFPTLEEVRESRISSKRGTPKNGSTPDGKKSNTKGMREKPPVPETEPLPDYYELDLPVVNYIENIAQTCTIYDDRKIQKMNALPRPGPKGLGNRNKVRTPWDFTLSVFASYKPDTTSLLNACFEKDWSTTKVARIVKDDTEREKLKNYTRSIYKWFREMYKYSSSQDPMNDIFCIGVNVFSDLLINGTTTLVDGKFLKLADVDLERIQTNANEENSKFNPKNNMVRHNFLEVFFRLCDTKYMKKGAGGTECDTFTKCFKMMFEKELYPWFSKFDSHQWRKEVLWQEYVDYTLKIAIEPLKAIYRKNVGKNSLPGGKQYMSLTEFSALICASDCLSDNFGAKQIATQFNLSMMTQVDELEKDKHINMNFVEFLEAIVRVAEKTEIPHCKLDDHIWGVTEILQENREIYAKRDIVVKLEALIFFLIKGNLGPSAYTKHMKMIEELEGAGFYANDLDTGSFNLNDKKE